MNVATSNNTGQPELAAAVFAPVAPEDFYRAVLDVRGFPAWSPGVRRVEVLSGEGGAGMLSEWEVSFLGLRKRVLSRLEEAEAPSRLRWTYEGPVEGWGRCSIERVGEGSLASFETALAPADPFLASLARGAAARGAARTHLKRSLSRLGRLVAGADARVLVGPVVQERRIGSEHDIRNLGGAGFKPVRAHQAGELIRLSGNKKEGPEGPSSSRRLPHPYSK